MGLRGFFPASVGRGISIHPSRVGWDKGAVQLDADQLISIHPSRVGWDTARPAHAGREQNFNPPIPCGMGPGFHIYRASQNMISIHPSRVGWDRSKRLAVTSGLYFNPPIPCGMGQRTRVQRSFRAVFQSTHPVWDGTIVVIRRVVGVVISIHPSRVGWDSKASWMRSIIRISIHPSRVGWDLLF